MAFFLIVSIIMEKKKLKQLCWSCSFWHKLSAAFVYGAMYLWLQSKKEAALVETVDSKECGLPMVAETPTLKRNVAVEFLKIPSSYVKICEKMPCFQ